MLGGARKGKLTVLGLRVDMTSFKAHRLFCLISLYYLFFGIAFVVAVGGSCYQRLPTRGNDINPGQRKHVLFFGWGRNSYAPGYDNASCFCWDPLPLLDLLSHIIPSFCFGDGHLSPSFPPPLRCSRSLDCRAAPSWTQNNPPDQQTAKWCQHTPRTGVLFFGQFPPASLNLIVHAYDCKCMYANAFFIFATISSMFACTYIYIQYNFILYIYINIYIYIHSYM